jgi:hypothetical protein
LVAVLAIHFLIRPRDRTGPVGYKVSLITFANGEPVAPANSMTANADIFANSNNSVCPNNCFRPVGIAIDGQGRMFVSSDATGEIYVVVKDHGTTASNPTSSPSGTSTSTGIHPTVSSAATKLGVGLAAYLAFFMCLMMYRNI